MLRRRTAREVASSGTSDTDSASVGVGVTPVAVSEHNGEQLLFLDTLAESSRPQLRRRTQGTTTVATSASTLGGATTTSKEQRRVRLLARSDRSYRTRSALDSTEDHTTTDRGFAAEEDQKERATKALLTTLEEKLFERLEHHGVRRCTVDDEGDLNNRKPSTSFKSCYYMCVPCEVHVTRVLTSPPSVDDLADTIYHCSSATHRLYTRFMCIAETDAALISTPFPDPGMHTTIDINGVRALVSTMPGGSTMFHPDPLESEAAYHRVEEAFYNHANKAASGAHHAGEPTDSKTVSAKLASHTNESVVLHELIRPRRVLQVLQQEERAAVEEHLANIADTAAAGVGGPSQVCLFPPTDDVGEPQKHHTRTSIDADNDKWSEGKALFPTKAGNVLMYHPVSQFVDPYAVWVLIPPKKQTRRQGVATSAKKDTPTRRSPKNVVYPRWIRVATRLIAPTLSNRFELYPLVVARQRPVAEQGTSAETVENGPQEGNEQRPAKKRPRRDPAPNYSFTPHVAPCAELVCLTNETPTSQFAGPGFDSCVHRIEVPEDSSLRLVVRTTKAVDHHDGREDSCRLHDLIRARPAPSVTLARRHVTEHKRDMVTGADTVMETQQPAAHENLTMSQSSDHLPLTQLVLSQLTYSQRQEEELVQSSFEAQQWQEDMKFFDMVRNFRRRRHEHHNDPNEIRLEFSSFSGSRSAMDATKDEHVVASGLAEPGGCAGGSSPTNSARRLHSRSTASSVR
jgi:hypothetical protein